MVNASIEVYPPCDAGPHLGRCKGELDVVAAPGAGLGRAAAQRAHAAPCEASLMLDPVVPASPPAQRRWADLLLAAGAPDRLRRRGCRATIAEWQPIRVALAFMPAASRATCS